MGLDDDETLALLKTHFRIYFPNLMSTIVKILLYKEEEDLACLLTAYYELSLDTESYLYAIEGNNFKWLSFVWAFGKNWILSRRSDNAQLVNIKQLLGMIDQIFKQN